MNSKNTIYPTKCKICSETIYGHRDHLHHISMNTGTCRNVKYFEKKNKWEK